MSLLAHKRTNDKVRFPRVSGDEPAMGGSGEAADVFSPRERG